MKADQLEGLRYNLAQMKLDGKDRIVLPIETFEALLDACQPHKSECGFVTVPRDPTHAMTVAGMKCGLASHEANAVYKAMLAASEGHKPGGDWPDVYGSCEKCGEIIVKEDAASHKCTSERGSSDA